MVEWESRWTSEWWWQREKDQCFPITGFAAPLHSDEDYSVSTCQLCFRQRASASVCVFARLMKCKQQFHAVGPWGCACACVRALKSTKGKVLVAHRQQAWTLCQYVFEVTLSLCAFGLKIIKLPIKLVEMYHCQISLKPPLPTCMCACASQSLVKEPQDIRDHRTSFELQSHHCESFPSWAVTPFHHYQCVKYRLFVQLRWPCAEMCRALILTRTNTLIEEEDGRWGIVITQSCIIPQLKT